MKNNIISDKKYLILGHGGHGKDTVAEYISNILDIKFTSSSMFALEKAVIPYLADLGITYPTKEACYEDRRNKRDLWKAAIDGYNTPDKARLCKALLETCNMYVGMRADREYREAKHLFDYIIWVDSSARVPEKDTTMKIDFEPDDMILLPNNRNLSSLQKHVEDMLDSLTIECLRNRLVG